MPEPTTGFLFGIFDLFNVGHLDAVTEAARACDRLVVAVATDELVEEVTGGVRPFVPAIERTEIIGAVGVVAEVVELTSLDVAALAATSAGSGATVLFRPSADLDAVQIEAQVPADRLRELPPSRRTASAQLRAALAGTTQRSSVA